MASGAKDPRKSRAFRLAALLRLGIAAAALALFIYAYLGGNLRANAVLEPAMKSQFSAVLYGTGLGGLPVILGIALALFTGRAFCSVLCPLGTSQELLWRGGNFIRRFRRGEVSPLGRTRSRPTPLSGAKKAYSLFCRSPRLSDALSRCEGATSRGGKGGMDAADSGRRRPEARNRMLRAGGTPPATPPGLRRGYKAPPKFRYGIPLLTGLGLALALSPLMAALDPISNFGRGMAALAGVLHGKAEPSILILALPFALILGIAFFRGRAFCDFCPLGLSLGLLGKIAFFRMNISPRCVSCGICEKKCPARCLDSQEKRIDKERCVLCFSCAAVCPTGSAAYGPRREKALSGESRRVFLTGAAPLLWGAAYFLGADARRLAPVFRLPGGGAWETAGGTFPILPPGAKNLAWYRGRCIGCQACASACPSGIIGTKNSTRPVLDYAEAYCHYNCLECGKVCPTGAIRRLDMEEKHRTRIALSALLFENCVVNTRGEACGACAEVCPTRAVRMTDYPDPGIPYLTRPVFDGQYCIGCGACLSVCPAEPKAFRIAAVAEQVLTPGMREEEDGGEEGFLYQPTEDFPF